MILGTRGGECRKTDASASKNSPIDALRTSPNPATDDGNKCCGFRLEANHERAHILEFQGSFSEALRPDEDKEPQERLEHLKC
jgi:hypothetical protein